ncbi:MAG: ABC transporter permease [Chlamydiales bacterium]|nr:ABC transporter permease [Chlamydiales bacterium]
MLLLSLKILIGDKAKFIGIVLGLSFASFIIVQQAAIFVGLMARTFGFITDTSQPDIWVMDEKVQFIEDTKPLRATQLYLVRGIDGVEWAVPFYKGLLKARLQSGNFQICNVIGIDEASLIGGPPVMLEGSVLDLRKTDGIIVNKVGADGKLSSNGKNGIPLQVGETIEINDHRAQVVGICKSTRTFQSQPVIYTTYARATSFAPYERKLLSFILVKAKPGLSPEKLCASIQSLPGLTAYTSSQFKRLTIEYYMKNTGIPLNFGMAVLLGFIIGMAISGQTFYNFILDNLRYLGTFKAMGANNRLLTKMVLLQAVWVGFIGWGLGIGAAALFGFLSRNSDLSFLLMWQLYVISGITMFTITGFSAWIGLYKVYRLDPAIVFKG